MLRPQFNEIGRVRAVNLKESVPLTIKGRDFFGRKAWLKFQPVDSNGWYGNTKSGSGCKEAEILYPELVMVKKRRLCLINNEGGVWLNCFEHITTLRLLGLDKISISCGPGSWPPFLLAGELWEQLSPHLQYADYTLDWHCSLNKATSSCQGFQIRSTNIVPMVKNPGVFINSCIKFDSLPESNKLLRYTSTLDWDYLMKILFSSTQGWPRWLHPLSKIIKFLGWPHCQRVQWPQCSDPFVTMADIAEMFNEHRIADILGAVGAMSLSGKRLISCQVNSYKGGHFSDVHALRESLGIK